MPHPLTANLTNGDSTSWSSRYPVYSAQLVTAVMSHSELETAAVIALLRRKYVAATKLAELVETTGSALQILEDAAGSGRLFAEVTSDSLDKELEEIAAEIQAWREEGISVLSIFHDDYPLNLRAVHDRPAVLFVRGALAADDTTAVAVVGTRQASELGLRRARALAAQLADAGHVIASGLAAGIDTAAHTSALQAGGRTIAVIGTGLRHSFPKENAALQRQLGETSAVISQFWPDQRGAKWTFPQRNAVMSGVSLATVVVEASRTSGARIQARLALEHGRPVFFLRSMLDHEWARDYSERPGVYVADTTDDVVRRLERLYPRTLINAT